MCPSQPPSLRDPAQKGHRAVDGDLPRAVPSVGLRDDASHGRRDDVVERVPVPDPVGSGDADAGLGVLVLVPGRRPGCRYAPVDDPREEGRDAVVVRQEDRVVRRHERCFDERGFKCLFSILIKMRICNVFQSELIADDYWPALEEKVRIVCTTD